jgi:hypothetical protein
MSYRKPGEWNEEQNRKTNEKGFGLFRCNSLKVDVIVVHVWFVTLSISKRSDFRCLTEWLSGSGGTGETLHIIAPFLANRACTEWQSRCPTGAGVRRY